MIDAARHAGLNRVPGFPFAVFASAGAEPRAAAIARRCGRAHRFLGSVLGFSPPFALLVLGPDDWESRANHPLYGMPNYVAGNLVVAAEPNPFWQGFVDLVADRRPDLLPGLRAVYGDAAGAIDLAPFFDLIAVHELAHEFHGQVPYRFPRLWLEEVFVNLCLHAYVAAEEPDLLPVLETLPAALAASDPAEFPHRSLAALEALHAGVGPVAYGWYQGRFLVAAARIFEAGGVDALRRLWDAFVIDDATLRDRLRAVQPELADVLTEWPN